MFAEESSEEADDADTKDPVPPATPAPKGPVSPGTSSDEFHLMFHINESELRNQDFEVQAMHVRVRAIELECQPRVPSQPAVTQSPHSPCESFDVSKHI